MSGTKAWFFVFFIPFVFCDVDLWQHTIFKRASDEVSCKGGNIVLCEGVLITATQTDSTVEEEAMEKQSTKLYIAYDALTQEEDYDKVLTTGTTLGLSKDETQAVRLYTMDSMGLFSELNNALREGVDKYPVLHYWLQSAIAKLKVKTQSNVLFMGYKKLVNVTTGTRLHLPGYSSAFTGISGTLKEFVSPGCTILKFDSSRQGASVNRLSESSGETEILIPPTEIFDVYDRHYDGTYHFIHLKPSTVGKRSTSVYTLCDEGNTATLTTLSPLLLLLVCLQVILAGN